MNISSISNNAFGKVVFKHIGEYEGAKIKAQKSKIENVAKGNDVCKIEI